MINSTYFLVLCMRVILPPLPPASAWRNKEARGSLSGTRGVEVPPSHAEPVRHVSGASHRSEGAWGTCLRWCLDKGDYFKVLL